MVPLTQRSGTAQRWLITLRILGGVQGRGLWFIFNSLSFPLMAINIKSKYTTYNEYLFVSSISQLRYWFHADIFKIMLDCIRESNLRTSNHYLRGEINLYSGRPYNYLGLCEWTCIANIYLIKYTFAIQVHSHIAR